MLLSRPSAIIVGAEALRRAWWSTQIPTRPVVAVADAQPLPTSAHYVIEHRGPAWYASIRRGRGYRLITSRHAPLEQRAMPMLRPAWALADMLSRSGWGACGLDPDDIDWAEITKRDRADWMRACAAFGLAPELAV